MALRELKELTDSHYHVLTILMKYPNGRSYEQLEKELAREEVAYERKELVDCEIVVGVSRPVMDPKGRGATGTEMIYSIAPALQSKVNELLEARNKLKAKERKFLGSLGDAFL